MTDFVLREPRESDWASILEIAEDSIAEAPAAGPQDDWLENRRSFDTANGARRHFVAAKRDSDEPIGYGAVESRRDAGPGVFRLYVVTRTERLEDVGAALYERACDAARELEATRLLFLEYTACETLGAFAEALGFAVESRFDLPDGAEVTMRTLDL